MLCDEKTTNTDVLPEERQPQVLLLPPHALALSLRAFAARPSRQGFFWRLLVSPTVRIRTPSPARRAIFSGGKP
jgi:hypothetical protein